MAKAKLVKITPPVRSYFARYWAKDGKTLVGGILSGETSRFQRWQDLMDLLETKNEVNGGRLDSEVVPSARYPEIFVHCGDIATAINCRCPVCRKLLTVEDAKATVPVPNIPYKVP